MSTKIRNIRPTVDAATADAATAVTTMTAVVRFENEINRKIKHLLRVMATVEIVNNEGDKAIVASAIREGKQLLKQVSAARKAITTPLQEEVKQWIAKEKELVAPIEEAMQRADGHIQQFNAQVAAQQQAVLDRIAEEEQVRLQEEDGNTEQVIQESQFKPACPVGRRQIAVAQHSTEGVRHIWTFEVQNLANVPHDYLMLNEQKVRQAIRSGERSIPGLMIFQKQQTACLPAGRFIVSRFVQPTAGNWTSSEFPASYSFHHVVLSTCPHQ